MVLRRRFLVAAALPFVFAAPLLGCSSILGADFGRDAAPDAGDEDGDGGTQNGDGGTHDGGAITDASHESSAPSTVNDSGVGGGGGGGGADDGGDDDDDSLDATSGHDASPGQDAALDSGPHDAAPDVVNCVPGRAPAAHDLQITELMIATITGSETSDNGEWLEITNVSGCPLPIAGLQIFSPSSYESNGDAVTISTSDTTVIANGGTFIVADVPAPTGIGAPVYSWNTYGSLEDDDTVTVSLGNVTITSLEYQWNNCISNESICYDTGHSIELPPGCTTKNDARNWLQSNSAYATNLYGTPQAPNSDVVCKP